MVFASIHSSFFPLYLLPFLSLFIYLFILGGGLLSSGWMGNPSVFSRLLIGDRVSEDGQIEG